VRRLFAHVRQQGVRGAWLEKTILPSHLKKLVYARMEKTGESYEQALRHVREQEKRAPGAAGPCERFPSEAPLPSAPQHSSLATASIVRAARGGIGGVTHARRKTGEPRESRL
jgi:hypothetical protein